MIRNRISQTVHGFDPIYSTVPSQLLATAKPTLYIFVVITENSKFEMNLKNKLSVCLQDL
jgi:hypothetical protein